MFFNLRLTPSPNNINRFSKLFPPFQTRLTPSPRFFLITSPNINHQTNNNNKHLDFDNLFLACTNICILKSVHARLVVSGEAQRNFFPTKLVPLYADYGDISSSCLTFERILVKNVFAWNSMISGFVRNCCFGDAVDLYYEMVETSVVRPDCYTFPVVLKACGALSDGRRLHCWVVKLGVVVDFFVASSLVHMYTRVGVVDGACKVFDEMGKRDLGSWNAMVSGYCQNGRAEEAMGVFEEMRLKGMKMDSFTITSILPVCAPLDDFWKGQLVHVYVIKEGWECNVFVCNALIIMYAKFGRLRQAREVFNQMAVRDLVSWNSLISAYEQNNDPVAAHAYFDEMKLNGFQPDVLTLVSLASVVAQSGDYRNSKSVHCFITRRNWITRGIFAGNAVMDMYAKLGNISYAKRVFEGMHDKDAISWNSLITGYTQNGLVNEAIELYDKMEGSEGVRPGQGTLVSVLPAYSHVGALQKGMKIHGRSIKVGLDMDIFVGTCLIDMYAKCGKLDNATSLFEQVPRRSTVPWNAMICGHGIHGFGEKALEFFEEMQKEGVKPDHVTFVSVLSACSHAGLVDQVDRCFHLMQEKYGIKPILRHYGCMVDSLGRSGRLAMAYKLIKNMPVKPDATIWGALLGACRIHGNVELGKLASERLFEVDSKNAGYYVLLSNIYANVGRWEEVDKVRSLANDRGLRKTPGWSSIELKNRVDIFYTGNQSHPQCEKIYKELEILLAKMKILGYLPDYSFVLQDVEEDEKQHILTSHSERLAIAFGIISTPPKTSIRIFKNLRVCGDCHNATKFISKITEREIIVRDSNRFHHFKDGDCSCGDYW